MLTMYLVSATCLFLGIGMKYFKWDFLIAGYNTMKKEKKENIDIEGLRKYIGNYMILVAFILFIGAIAGRYGYKNISLGSFLLLIPMTVFLIIKAQKYDHNKKRKNNALQTKIAVAFIVLVFVSVGALFFYGTREPRVEVTKDTLKIKSIYSNYIQKEEIEEITLETEIPKVVRKVSGFDFGYVLRGSFKIEKIGISNIYIHEKSSPYIVIKKEKGYIIINYKEKNKTKEVYNRLIKEIGSPME